MIKPNWEIFRAKFSENPQYNFEWFCYLLFCKEFNQPHGIFRFRNQSAIETNPIVIGDEVIGWQAKFYDSSLSNYKEDFISTIEKAKRDYPDITKLIFYTHQEWGQTKGKEPKGLRSIKSKAEELGIKLEWKTASYFESEFVVSENEVYSKHFFSLDKSIIDLAVEQKKHTEVILNQIQSCIVFNGQGIEIKRDDLLERLKNESPKIVILSGIGGVGKTALIKKLYEKLKEEVPFFVFKATEFNLINVSDLFANFSVFDFSVLHKDKKNKVIVIDSAEKLLDLKNPDPFKEFLSIVIEDEWKIIFTTRGNYLEDLNYQFFEIYNIAPLNLRLNRLELNELSVISDEYIFSLPKDEKLLELIRSPFYLNEYLRYYKDNQELNYSEFKNKLWNKNIKKAKPERERCFLQVALERANEGQFFVAPCCESNILDDELVADGILGYEAAGYFITHDIYEEWALEKHIESEFLKKSSNQLFFEKIGQSLPVRRCFRNWLSEKLLLNGTDVKALIEEVVENKEIEAFWKDEVIVSVLLSNYSKAFFDIFEDKLLSDEQLFLKKITFILRVACKEIDDSLFKHAGIKNSSLLYLKYVLTKPKGQGWESLISFVFDNLHVIGIKNINFILPVIYDWNSKIKEGATTRLSSLIALQYYQWIIEDDVYYSRDDIMENLFQTILYGAAEIKYELKAIFDEILINKWKGHQDPYCDLSKFILTNLEGITVSKVLPDYVLRLADLFWTYTQSEHDSYYHSGIEIAQRFGLDSIYSDYHPASAYQTSIYWLLHFHLKGTIDFILNFTNKSVQRCVASDFDSSVQKVNLFLSDKDEQSQYVSHCLWNMYRGTSSPVSPYLLQSIHMALEKFLLEFGRKADLKDLEGWLFYLLKHSESASISSVVTSIVLAYPEKTFGVAKVLFRTKEFILQDTTRLVSDQGAKSLYSLGRNMGSTSHELYDDERIKTCEDEHRKWTLEHLFLNYQCFRGEEVSESEMEQRQVTLWEILDRYYKELPSELEQTESDKVWRLFLARMDKRKMNVTTEKTDNGIAIQFTPELESDLKEYSEKSLADCSEPMKYSSLKMWAELKFRMDDKYGDYEQYENDPMLALKETKDIVEKLRVINVLSDDNSNSPDEGGFILFNHSIPAYVCSVLLRDYFELLTKDDKCFCRDIVMDVASLSFHPNYEYQISDGVQPAITVLPVLMKEFPKEKEVIKSVLLLTLFNECPVGGMLSTARFNIFPITAIHSLWDKNFDDAQSLLFGYLLLKPKYDDLCKIVRKENIKKGIFDSRDNQLWTKFIGENEDEMEDVVRNKISLSDLKNVGGNDLSILQTAFQMIPQKTESNDHKAMAEIIVAAFVGKLLLDDKAGRDGKVDPQVKHDFLVSYAYFVLTLKEHEIQGYLKPFLDNFRASELFADLFRQFILCEDRLGEHTKFWIVWAAFKDKVFDICRRGDRHWDVEKIVRNYLFAQEFWDDSAKEWHTLKDDNKRFFREISKGIGHCPSVLYAISKLLNGIGSQYLDDGVDWISYMLANNKVLVDSKLEVNTIYYMESLVRRYVFENREKIKKTKSTKDSLLLILDYLIEKGSVVGYMLRESIV